MLLIIQTATFYTEQCSTPTSLKSHKALETSH